MRGSLRWSFLVFNLCVFDFICYLFICGFIFITVNRLLVAIFFRSVVGRNGGFVINISPLHPRTYHPTIQVMTVLNVIKVNNVNNVNNTRRFK